MAYTLNDNLKCWAEQYETAEFIQSDPVQIPHRYDSRVNIEISAFVTAWIAWGSRKQIIQKADFIDREIFKGAPYHYIVAPVTTEPEPEKEQPTAVADLSIADVLKMRLFYDNAAAEIRDIWEKREKARKELKPGERLQAHPIDKLHAAGLLEPGEFVVTFAKIMDKRETRLSSMERGVIHTLGMTAFSNTMQKLIADEKSRNNSDGNNKQ